MRFNSIITNCFILLIVACTSRQTGTLKGTVSPSEPLAHIAIVQNDKSVVSFNSTAIDGAFSANVNAGIYSIVITSPASTVPVTITDIKVQAGEITLVPPVNIAVQKASAIVTGKITPACPGTKVKLIREGKERAAANTGADGTYEFSDLPAGKYAIQAEAPGYAEDTSSFNISAEQKTEQNVLLLPITTVAGVDWASGKIRATGHGQPPAQAASSTVRREMAKRAALSDAQRNLLKIIENIRINSTLDIKTYMQNATHEERIQGFIRGYTVLSETDRDDGSIDVILELPLTGPTGLSHYITE